VDVMVDAFTIEMGSVENREPDKVRDWPLNGFWVQPAWRTVKTAIIKS